MRFFVCQTVKVSDERKNKTANKLAKLRLSFKKCRKGAVPAETADVMGLKRQTNESERGARSEGAEG